LQTNGTLQEWEKIETSKMQNNYIKPYRTYISSHKE